MRLIRKTILLRAVSLCVAAQAWTLDFRDIQHLLQSGVDESVIINMVRATPLTAALTAGDVIALSSAGASTGLMEFLTSSAAVTAADSPTIVSAEPTTVYVEPSTTIVEAPTTIIESPTYVEVPSVIYTEPYYYNDYYYNDPFWYGSSYPRWFGGSWHRPPPPPRRPSHRPPSRPSGGHRPGGGGPSVRPPRPGGRPPSGRPGGGGNRPSRPGGERPSRPGGGERPSRPGR